MAASFLPSELTCAGQRHVLFTSAADCRNFHARVCAAPCCQQVFKADAHYVGSKIDIYALKERPEFAGCYRRVHKGAVVLALSPRSIPQQCETEVRAALGGGSAAWLGWQFTQKVQAVHVKHRHALVVGAVAHGRAATLPSRPTAAQLPPKRCTCAASPASEPSSLRPPLPLLIVAGHAARSIHGRLQLRLCGLLRSGT